MSMYRENTGQNCDIEIHHKFSENMAKVKYLEMIVTNKHCISSEIKSRLSSGNAFDHSVQESLPFCLLSEVLNFKMCNCFIFQY
jgi:hypothetical protein